MWLQLSQVKKKKSPKETGENQHLFFYADVTKIQKNTRGSGLTRESSLAHAYGI